jgi:hypothetical protein
VFEIYQDFPDPNLNYGLIVNETSAITGVCAAWGQWNPPILPACIRKYDKKDKSDISDKSDNSEKSDK